jgi:hypothetical protein
MRLNDVTADGQTQTCASLSSGIRAVLCGVKGLEYATEFARWNADPVISHADLGESTSRVEAQTEPRESAVRHSLAGIDQ